MRNYIVLFTFLWLVGSSSAADRVVVTQVSSAHVPKGTNASPSTTTLSGPDFKKIEENVKAVISLLGNKTEWWDVGPDASYVSAEIHYRDKRYVLNSWYPLFHDKTKIAVSETQGLVPVSGPEEKKWVEGANSKQYQELVGFLEMINIPKQTAAPNDPSPRR